MSALPRYSFGDFEEAHTESSPLVTGNERDAKLATAATRADRDLQPIRHAVTYVFEPVYPVPGKREQVVGPLGRDMDVSRA